MLMLAVTAILAASCGRVSQRETTTRGSITVLVDENLMPMAGAQAQVFQFKYPSARITLSSQPEALIPSMMSSDSLRTAIMARPLNDNELAWFSQRQFTPVMTPIAYDGVALVVSRQSPDSTIMISDLKAMFAGQNVGKAQRVLVFDNPASGTVRYMKQMSGLDSLPGAFSFRSTAEMLEYVAVHPQAIGFTSVDWVNEADSSLMQMVDKLRVLAVGDKTTGFFRPTPSDIANGRYPFARRIYFINAQATNGLGLGFSAFIAGDIGQRIILSSGLVPIMLPRREIRIRTQL